MDRHDMLYEFLNGRESCAATEHRALLQLPVLDDAAIDMFLLACSDTGTEQYNAHYMKRVYL